MLEGKKHGKRVICDFYATWCPPCKVAAPIYGNLSKEHTNVLFLKVNVDEARDVARSCDNGAITNVQVLCRGKRDWQLPGLERSESTSHDKG